ncbi:MAG TPA: MASE4 domain-containing protein [Burkholderiales bacterium]|nr:MASE4 domain-containing protein [Burkholderiales bacterium]
MHRRLAAGAVAVSALIFVAVIPFAATPLAPLPAFIGVYQAALVVCDLVTAILLFGQARYQRATALWMLAAGYLFTAGLAVTHTLSFPGLFAPGGLLGAGAQSTAWLYMFWHAGFPLFVIAYAGLKSAPPPPAPNRVALAGIAAVVGAVAALTWLATGGAALLPAIMNGNRYSGALIFVVSGVWLFSLAALYVLWRAKPHSVFDLWLMVVLFAWLCDIGLAAVFNAGRFDVGFYAGRLYGLLAASFVLIVLLLENGALHARLARAHQNDQRSLARHGERLRILAAIDQAVVAEQAADAIAAAVIQPLRELLGVPRAIVNKFDLAAGQVEWVAAAGRRRTHVGPGVRYSLALMGDVPALRAGEPQLIDVQQLPPGPEAAALLASGVRWYVAVPMIAGGELIGALSFGGERREFSAEQLNIAREVATQLAIATRQTRLLERVRAHAAELESKVRSRTAALEAANHELESFSYSVSHDLRAPLRAIDGYARMLDEDHAERLDAEGRRLTAVVRSNAKKMGQLIDDLLVFSRLGRQELLKRRVDMTALAQEVVQELGPGYAARIELGELPAAPADRALLKQAWLNLVGNALKYSAKREAPRIELGARREAHENVYWVRDNGVGFDMRYAEKLFGVFQRLHTSDEFPGTGVGLAIVQRVINRHGGRVWANGRPGDGATFSFSLPSANQSDGEPGAA